MPRDDQLVAVPERFARDDLRLHKGRDGKKPIPSFILHLRDFAETQFSLRNTHLSMPCYSAIGTKAPLHFHTRLMPGKELYDALRCIGAKKSRVVPCRLRGCGGAARKQGLFILFKGQLDVSGVCTKGLSEFGTVVEC